MLVYRAAELQRSEKRDETIIRYAHPAGCVTTCKETGNDSATSRACCSGGDGRCPAGSSGIFRAGQIAGRAAITTDACRDAEIGRCNRPSGISDRRCC